MVSLKRGILGRIFNFGTICVELYMASNRYEVLMHRVPHPETYIEVIEKTLAEFGSPSLPNDS